MSAQPDTSEGKSDPGLVTTLLAIVLLTVVAAVSGFGIAWLAHTKASAAKDVASKEATAAKPSESKLVVKPLPTILTRLSGKQAPWLRLNLAIVVPKSMPEQDRFAELIAQDVLAFVATLQVDQVSGPSSFDTLRADLQEIVKLRSKGAATEVFVRGLLME